MTLIIPHTFIDGTKANADEVNANFTAVKSAVDTNTNDISGLQSDLSSLESTLDNGKADKVAEATENNLAKLDDEGNIADSGVKIDDSAEASSSVIWTSNKLNSFKYREKLPQISNNTSDIANDIDITSGYFYDSTDSMLISLSALTKKLDAFFATGTNQGACVKTAKTGTISINGTAVTGTNTLFATEFQAGDIIYADDGSTSGVVSTISSNTSITLAGAGITASNKAFSRLSCAVLGSLWFNVFAISGADGAGDVIFDTRLIPELPTGYTKYRLIGFIRTSAAGALVKFTQKDNYFEFVDLLTADYSATSSYPNSKTNLTVLTPKGVTVKANFKASIRTTDTFYWAIFGSNQADYNLAQDDCDLRCGSSGGICHKEITRLVTNSTIAHKFNATSASSSNATLRTLGFSYNF